MPSFDIPLSGLDADSTALNTIANNLSNMSTNGYKAQTTTFSDLFYQEIGSSGSGDLIEEGSGVRVATNTTDFTTGSISSTGCTDDDVAIDGSGFFVLDNNGSQLYTRNGGFEVSSNGTLESSGGLAVMGYSATNGVVNTSGALSDIVIPTTATMAPSATTTIGVTQNLDSADAVGSTASSPITVYDSLGQSYSATITYTKTGTNEWSYDITLPNTLTAASSTASGTTTINYDFGSSGSTYSTVNTGTDLTITGDTASGTATIAAPTVTAGESIDDYTTALKSALTTAGITGVTVSDASGVLTITGTNFSTSGSVIQDPVASSAASGTLTFDADGNLTSPAADVSGITFSGLSDGAATLNLSWDLYGSTGSSNISQTSSASSTSDPTQNGYASGTYQSFSVDSDGVITAKFSNSQTETVGQLALATVSNEQGLQAVGSTDYAATNASGNASVGVAGSGGRGTIEDSSLEASNVDISTEFSDLIVAQRAFEANAKSVTTFDTVTQEAINMIH